MQSTDEVDDFLRRHWANIGCALDLEEFDAGVLEMMKDEPRGHRDQRQEIILRWRMAERKLDFELGIIDFIDNFPEDSWYAWEGQ